MRKVSCIQDEIPIESRFCNRIFLSVDEVVEGNPSNAHTTPDSPMAVEEQGFFMLNLPNN